MDPILTQWMGKEPRKQGWLWDRRIPSQRITVVDGDPGTGKSLFTIWLAAELSAGRLESGPPAPVSVIIVNCEDEIETQLVPRLAGHGADSKLIHFFQAVDTGAEEGELFQLPGHSAALRKAIVETRAQLVIIDPLSAYLSPEVRMHSDHSMRAAMMPLNHIAEETGATFVLVRHLNKAGGPKALYRGLGTIGVVGLARSVLLVCTNPEDAGERLLVHVKSNFDTLAPSLAFNVQANAEGVPVLTWDGVREITATQALIERAQKLPVELAMDFINKLLPPEGMIVEEVRQLATKAGISERTLQRAKQRLNVQARTGRFGTGRSPRARPTRWTR